MMLGAPGSSVMRPVVHTVRGPHCAGKRVVDLDAEFRQRQPGIPAYRHPRGAGVVLLAGEADPVLPDADDGGDDADLERAAFEHLALLDMRLEISDVAPALAGRARPAGETGLAQRIAHRLAAGAVARGVDIGFGDAADIGAAAEETAEMAFLVAPGRDFDGAVRSGSALMTRAASSA